MSYATTIELKGKRVDTLADVLPDDVPLKMLIVGKTPTPNSVAAGHYFQGRQGKMFWGKLQTYGLLKVHSGRFEDEALCEHGYGITDLVKVPREYGVEPSNDEYRANLPRVQRLIVNTRPKVLLFVYKGALDKVLKLAYGQTNKSAYGFNPDLTAVFHSKIFVFPMPGTPCPKEMIEKAMLSLQAELNC